MTPEERHEDTRKTGDVRHDERTGDDYVPLPTTLCLLLDRTLARRDIESWIEYFGQFEEDDRVTEMMFGEGLLMKSQRVRSALSNVRRVVEQGQKHGARWYSSRNPMSHRVFARLVFYAYRDADLPESKLREWATKRGSAIAQWGGLSIVDLLSEIA